ncbi:Zn-ribbon domain-containing OB-fold protein [Novosphingobium endophyticum]|nr:OB-fold domain-containing protein [Novosphingobium endophyticum]
MIQPEAEWRAHLEEGRFMIQRSRSTGGHVFYPRVAHPGTGADDLEWVEASGKGTVHAVTVVRKKDPADSYNVVLVDLAEGPRLMSRVDAIAVDEVKIGMAVRARIIDEGHKPLLVFVPA